MMTAESERGVHAALDIDPGDVLARLALADLCEEAGDMVRARGHRWQLSSDQWPAKARGGGWRWWRGQPPAREDRDDLPPAVFDLLAAGPRPLSPGRYYPSRRAAEDDLALALEALAQRGEMP